MLLSYLNHYPPALQQQVAQLINDQRLGDYLLKRYPTCHDIRSNKGLYDYLQNLKASHLKKSAPLNKVIYDDKIHVINNALGLHTQISRVQGGKLKAKQEIRIAKVFQRAPLAFLRMISVHELAHFKEREHNKAFYQLCQHIEPDYHQLEFDLRVYLTHLDQFGELY